MPERIFPIDTIALDRSSKPPLQRQLYQALKDLIETRAIPAGSVLPSTREFAADLKLGRNTVIAAYDQLITEGYLLNRPGARPRVIDIAGPATSPEPAALSKHGPQMSARGKLMAHRQFHYSQAGQMAFRPGMPDAGSFPFALLSRLIAKDAKFARDNLFGMYHVAGHPALRAAIATYLKTARGVKCTPEQIVVTTGAQAAMDLLARLFLDRGDTVWTEEPGYYGAQSAFVAAGAKLASLPVDRNGWRLDNTPNADPRLIYITPSCQHPLGMTMRMEQRLRLLDIAQSLNSLIIEDDFDGEYRLSGSPCPRCRGMTATEE